MIGPDGLHMTDASYGCLASQLAEALSWNWWSHAKLAKSPHRSPDAVAGIEHPAALRPACFADTADRLQARLPLAGAGTRPVSGGRVVPPATKNASVVAMVRDLPFCGRTPRHAASAARDREQIGPCGSAGG